MPKVKEEEEKEETVMTTYRILRGVASIDGTKYSVKSIDDGLSDIIKTSSNLLKYNSQGSKKFARASEEVEYYDNQEEDSLSELSLKELKQMAEEGEINLDGCGNNKAKIINKIKASE